VRFVGFSVGFGVSARRVGEVVICVGDVVGFNVIFVGFVVGSSVGLYEGEEVELLVGASVISVGMPVGD